VLACREPQVAEHTHDEANPIAYVVKLFREYGALIVRPEVARLMIADLCVTLGPGWMSALYIYFFEDSRGFDFQNASKLLTVYLAAGLVGAPVLGWLAAHIGKHRAMIIACTGYSLGLALLFFMPKGNLLIDGPFMFGMGFLASGFSLLIRAMVADVGDQVRLETGRQTIGVLYSLVTSTTKAASALAIFFTFSMLSVIGYKTAGVTHHTPEVIHKLELTYLVGPIVFVMLAGACFLGYRLDSTRHADIRRRLEARDAGMATPAGGQALEGEAVGTLAAIEEPVAGVPAKT
jgi:Na+/melibiose symporter-like transporter